MHQHKRKYWTLIQPCICVVAEWHPAGAFVHILYFSKRHEVVAWYPDCCIMFIFICLDNPFLSVVEWYSENPFVYITIDLDK
jgi:hypothetical protein